MAMLDQMSVDLGTSIALILFNERSDEHLIGGIVPYRSAGGIS